MECMNNRYSLNLTDSEQVLYIPNKNNVEFFVSFPLAVFGFCFFSWIIGVLTLKNVFILSELFIIALDVLCARQLYEYFRDYFFSKIFLTNEKIIIFRFNKIISVNYNQIEKIYYQEGRKSPSYFAILLNSQKIYKISFIPIKQFKQKIEEINQEIQYKNSVFWSSEILNTIYLAFSKNNQIQIKNQTSLH